MQRRHRNETYATQALALHAMRTWKTQASYTSKLIGCCCRAFLLAATCVRCVKNRIDSIVAFSYAVTTCISCVTCACVLLFFACVIFLHLLRFLCSFYFACVIFLMQDLACVWMETGLKTTQPSRSKPSPPPHSPSPGWQILRPRLAFSSLVNQSVK